MVQEISLVPGRGVVSTEGVNPVATTPVLEGERTIADWQDRFSDLPPDFVVQVVLGFNEVSLPNLVNARIHHDLMATRIMVRPHE
ncbi:hypothetical protein A2160_05775 [Candidatus Beckwithbacteria bacterium RBG_13_42_9]|uniref:Uncharacterized protein n=1 Tax=Candidatus Beckwithbacteria bacterium RBG_13_42_9 TaxID=1797457 RepID=A0A1F5E6D6_9BACT|nr:MAG: hypothetical protein A2160_05775 [Candidatus Beckwithbacteria bacterium RBG_13_42_9]